MSDHDPNKLYDAMTQSITDSSCTSADCDLHCSDEGLGLAAWCLPCLVSMMCFQIETKKGLPDKWDNSIVNRHNVWATKRIADLETELADLRSLSHETRRDPEVKRLQGIIDDFQE